jgi:hypothetical protein
MWYSEKENLINYVLNWIACTLAAPFSQNEHYTDFENLKNIYLYANNKAKH